MQYKFVLLIVASTDHCVCMSIILCMSIIMCMSIATCTRVRPLFSPFDAVVGAVGPP